LTQKRAIDEKSLDAKVKQTKNYVRHIFSKKIYRHFRLRKSQRLVWPINTFKLPEIRQKINGLLMLKGRVFPGCIAINNSYATQLEFTVAF
jgi:hypothetical protein